MQNREGSSTDRFPQTDRPLQEVYSLRCAPQILGAVRDQLRYARSSVEVELNGATDNPMFDTGDADVLHGGNFQGQQVTLAADALNEALTQMGVLAERQPDVLLSPGQNGGAPPLLAWEPGPNSGFGGAQLTATALVAEMRNDAQMAATSSIPTNGDNQDVVSMGALAARRAHGQTRRDLSARLSQAGLKVPEEQIWTSAVATVQFLSNQVPEASAYVIGEAGLTTALHEVGYTLTDAEPDFVVLGETRTYSFQNITAAVRLIEQGARFIATNSDVTAPSPEGPLPTTGSVAALIAKATGRDPYFIGKPNRS
jgi:hypothetical protein